MEVAGVKGLFGFGSPKQRRFAMQFGYAVRPSFWQELKANSHLVIAAVGTMALLGVAGTALWLAMPSGDRPAFAEPKPQVEAAAEAPAAEQAETVAANSKAVVTDGASVVSSQVAPKADAVRPSEAAEADIAALPRNDPRWTGGGKPPPAIDAKAVAVQTNDGAKTAFAEEDGAAKGAAAAAPSRRRPTLIPIPIRRRRPRRSPPPVRSRRPKRRARLRTAISCAPSPYAPARRRGLRPSARSRRKRRSR
jgi:hypothetical protein